MKEKETQFQQPEAKVIILQEQANQSIANANLAGILIMASCPCLIGWVTTNRKENLYYKHMNRSSIKYPVPNSETII